MTDSASEAVERLVERLHRAPLRVWSIVITVFGDAIAPRGGQVWLGDLIRLLERLAISPATLRTAISRLATDGWVERRRFGRRSFYGISTKQISVFQDAERRIYASHAPEWPNQRWFLSHPEDAEVAGRLKTLGFGILPGGWMIRPETTFSRDAEAPLKRGLFFEGRARTPMDPSTVWPLMDLAERYRGLLTSFTPLKGAVGAMSPVNAMAARTLLIHDLRRVVLKDPCLPAALLPQDWPGDAMRTLAAELYRGLVPASEEWLGECQSEPNVILKSPEPWFFNRFGRFQG
ncbi:MAG: PaaX family transcriptional regulator C-terminal domain-containing protein [Myxococcota bacterium]